MPRYSYNCAACGPFHAWRPMSDCTEPTTCPVCGTLSPRRIGAPSLPGLDRNTRIAHEHNERAQHEPRVEYRSAGTGERERHHDHRHARRYQVARRWMVGH